MTDSTGPLDGWEFESLHGVICATKAQEGIELFRDGVVCIDVVTRRDELPTLRAVLDELERRARAKWGETWGLPPGTCPRCRGNKVIPVYRPGSIDLADVDFGLGCLGGSPAGSGFDPCPECSG